MQELLSAGHELEPTLRDDNLQGEAEELKAKYLSKYKTAVVAAQESVGPILKIWIVNWCLNEANPLCV